MVELLPSSRPPAPDMRTAGDRGVLRDRAIAAAVDHALCYGLIELPIFYVASVVFGSSVLTGGTMVLSVLLLVPVHSTYAFAFEWRRARTPGKTWRELVVVTDDGGRISASASGVRNLLRYLDVLGVPPFVYLVGIVSALRSTRGQRVGDRLARTVVVRATGPSADGFGDAVE